MSNLDAVDLAIQTAQQAAAEAQPQQAVAPVQQPQAVAVAAHTPAPVSFDDLTNGGLAADDWLKVNEFGLVVGSHTDKLFPSAEFILNVAEVNPAETIKFGNPATYMKTYDRVTCASGGTWQEALAKAAQVDPNARTYISAELPLQVAEDIEVGGTVVAEKGSILGHSTSTTNYKNLSQFMKQVEEQGLKNSTVRVKVGFEKRTNANKNTWGVLTFELLGEAK